MTQRLFRFAELVAHKYGLGAFAIEGAPIPAPAELVSKQKAKLQELYDNFFSDRADYASSGTIPPHALFEFRKIGEPQITKLFKMMEGLVDKLDKLNVTQLFRETNKLLNFSHSISIRELEMYLEQFRTLHRTIDIRDKQQYVIGFKNRIKSISLRLVEVLDVLSKFVTPAVASHYIVGPVEYDATILHEGLIRRFLNDAASQRYGLDKDNWDMMFTDPLFRKALARLLHSWERNNYVWKPRLAMELKAVVEKFKERQQSNLDYLEQGETFAPSTSTSVPPERNVMWDPKTGPSQDVVMRTDPDVKEKVQEAEREKKRQRAEEEGEGSGEGSF